MHNKFKINIVLPLCLIFILINIISCTNSFKHSTKIYKTSSEHPYVGNDFKKKIKDTSNRDIMPGTEKRKGMRYRIYNSKGNIDNQLSYFLKDEQAWDKFISISNMTDKSLVYKLLLFVDYKQSLFQIDDTQVQDFTFKIDSKQTMEIPITIDNLADGLHDILLLIVIDPNIKSLDSKFRSTTANNNLLYFRFNIIVNKESYQTSDLVKYEQRDLKDSFPGILLNRELNDYKKNWWSDNLDIKEKLNFYAHISNKDFSEKQKCVLITLLDWKQVPFGENIFIFTEVDRGKTITVPFEVQMPITKGVYDITSILVLNPFEKLNNSNFNILTSARVGLKVENDR